MTSLFIDAEGTTMICMVCILKFFQSTTKERTFRGSSNSS